MRLNIFFVVLMLFAANKRMKTYAPLFPSYSYHRKARKSIK